jgi:hypothetical protein
MQSRISLLAAFFVLCAFIAAAQQSTRDVVFLKNGTIIKGTIIEIIPEKSIKIETADSSTVVYQMSEIDKINKEQVQEEKRGKGCSFTIFGGPAATTGNFEAEGGTTFPAWINDFLNAGPLQNPGFPGTGCAREGVAAGFQFCTSGTVGWLINASYARNNLSHNPDWTYPTSSRTYTTVSLETDRWTSVLVLTGITIGTNNSSSVNFFVAPLVGVIYTTSPNIAATISQYQATQTIKLESAASKALVYGGQLEFTFWGHLVLGVRYIYSEPKYDISYTTSLATSGTSGTSFSSQTGSISHKQITSLTLPYIGFSF